MMFLGTNLHPIANLSSDSSEESEMTGSDHVEQNLWQLLVPQGATLTVLDSLQLNY